jgi:hypothetical protein
MLCALVFALLLTCTQALAVKINAESVQSASGAEIKGKDDNSITVECAAQKDKQYVVMVVSEDGVGEGEVPTKESIGSNQSGVVVYMDQATGDSNEQVSFTVRPNLESGEAGDQYFVYVSSNEGSGTPMQRVALFSIEDVLENLGDANGDGTVDGQDVSLCVDNFTKGVALTEAQKSALDVDHSGRLDGQDVSMIVDFFTKGVALP